MRTGWKRSAANTPIWQVTDDSTSTVVFTAANVMFSFGRSSAPMPGRRRPEREVHREEAAKNMSSLASHTIVPTDTGFGRLTLTWGLVRGAAVAVDTSSLWLMTRPHGTLDPQRGHGKCHTVRIRLPDGAAAGITPIVGSSRRPTRRRSRRARPARRGARAMVRRRERGLPTGAAPVPGCLGRTSTTSEDLHEHGASPRRSSTPGPRILLYSDDVDTRAQVRLAVGRRPAPRRCPTSSGSRCATAPAVIAALDAGGVDLAILDGEADTRRRHGHRPAAQGRDLPAARRSCVLTGGRGRPGWPTWSRAEAAVPHPLDPIVLADAVADLMRRRCAELPTA